ncbi:MAG TPA: ATP-binding protein [Gammaproteobacteria bacterium]|nr:ATP-binding protein [Gammaproteobacteria bacterium]
MDEQTLESPANLQRNAPDKEQQLLRTMLNYMPIPAMLIEPGSGEVRFANAAADEAAGGRMPHGAPCGRDPAWGTITTAAGEPISAKDFPAERLARGERLRHFELQWRLPSGTHHLLLSGGKLPPMGADRGMVVLMFEDISRMKSVEAELRNANQRKDEFLAMLAHELRNPLMPVRNALAILGRADSREVAERARAMMDRHIKRMTRLIDDLLDFSRITRGKIRLQKEHVELKRAVDTAIETTRPMMAANRQQLTVSLPPQPICLNADLTRVEQILTNLLTNAARYTATGGHIWLTVRPDGDNAAVAVRDDGIGIPSDKLEGIFELFSQVEDGDGRALSGLGIGLTLVQRLAEMHGGSVTARSEGPGRGSEFIVRLPRLPRAEKAAPASSHKARCRVLVVDDNEDITESLGMMLELMGCEVRLASEGFGALDIAVQFQPHLIFLDVGLPEMDGYEVARRLRARLGHASTVLVALTGWSQEHHKRRAREVGFDHHFVKPVDPAAIEGLLAELKPAGVD